MPAAVEVTSRPRVRLPGQQLRQRAQVLREGRPGAGEAHRRGRVVGDEPAPVLALADLPTDISDLRILPEERAEGHAAEDDDDLRVDDRDLVAQPRGDAGRRLIGARIAVARRPALDDRGDVEHRVPLRVVIGGRQQSVPSSEIGGTWPAGLRGMGLQLGQSCGPDSLRSLGVADRPGSVSEPPRSIRLSRLGANARCQIKHQRLFDFRGCHQTVARTRVYCLEQQVPHYAVSNRLVEEQCFGLTVLQRPDGPARTVANPVASAARQGHSDVAPGAYSGAHPRDAVQVQAGSLGHLLREAATHDQTQAAQGCHLARVVGHHQPAITLELKDEAGVLGKHESVDVRGDLLDQRGVKHVQLGRGQL